MKSTMIGVGDDEVGEVGSGEVDRRWGSWLGCWCGGQDCWRDGGVAWGVASSGSWLGVIASWVGDPWRKMGDDLRADLWLAIDGVVAEHSSVSSLVWDCSWVPVA